MVAARLPFDTRTQTTQEGGSGGATRWSQRDDEMEHHGMGRVGIIDEAPARIASSDVEREPHTSIQTSEANALPTWAQGPADLAVASLPGDMSMSFDLEVGAEGLSVSDVALLGSWLDDYAIFQNLFPSA